MDSLSLIINNLKKEEIRNFKLLSKRYAQNEDFKVEILFDKIRKKEKEDLELVETLFPDDPDNMNAFYRLRNRLKTDLEKSLIHLHNGLDEKISVLNFITLSNIFSYKSQYDISTYYLKKAEKLAEKGEFYQLLHFIYNEFINLSNHFDGINPIDYIEKRKEVEAKSQVVTQANHAIAALSYNLRKTNFSKSPEGIAEMLNEILNKLQIAAEVYNTPNMKFKIHFCIRDILLQNKDFKELENYLIHTLGEFENENLFNKNTYRYKITLLTWIINTLSINKKWNDSIKYTEILLEELNKFNKLYYDKFIWTYYQSLVTNYISSDRLKEALELLQQIKELPAHKGVSFYDYAIYINLSLCYYFSGNLSAAIKTLSHLLTKETFPKFSVDFQLSISLLEIILHYENNNHDFVSYKINDVKRLYRNLLKRPEYYEEKSFLKIMNMLATRPAPFKDKKIINDIENFIAKTPSLQVGSGKHIDFGIWMRAKLKKESYYHTLLETLKSN